MIKMNPRVISGSWVKGYVLDEHTLSSKFLGYDENGIEQFDTKRSDIGELIYRLKYGADKTALEPIIEVAVKFLKKEKEMLDNIEGIIPVPPSNSERPYQPVIEIAKGISKNLGVKYYGNLLTRSKESPELKNVLDYRERKELLKDAFTVDINRIQCKNILLVDDLYRSGATLKSVTKTLYNQGKVNKVNVLVFTKTRTLR